MQGDPVDTATESVERLADWVARDYTAMRAHPTYPWPEDRTHGETLAAATIRALAAERDALLAVARAVVAYRDEPSIDVVLAYDAMLAALDSLPPGTLDQSDD